MRHRTLLLLLVATQAHGQSSGVPHPATDDLARVLPTYEEVGGIRPDKTVAMFYWTWHVRHSQFNKAFNVSEIVDGHPDMVNDYDHPMWAPYTAPAEPDQYAYFWEESMFGYYDGRDKWVIRKQLEMLGDAGVDVLFFDATNGSFTWKDGYEAVGEVMAEARMDGVDVPQFGFMLNFGPQETTAVALGQLYDELYSIGKFQESWFEWEGKPAIMAYPEALDGIAIADSASLKFTAGSPFTGISARCPSWSNNIGDLTLSLYTWDGTLETSVAAEPVASQAFVDFVDNTSLEMEFGELPAGDYVWRLDGARETVGVWKFDDDTAATESWFNGAVVPGDYDSRIRYTADGEYSALTTGTGTTAVQLNEGIMSAVKANAIRSFFTFRPAQPGYQGGPTRSDQWGWLENHPQNGYVQKSPGQYELVTVGVAQNWSEQTNGLSAMNGPQVHGRSYTEADGFSLLGPDSYLHGYNFQEQWDRALQIDPDIVFITGWNEWVMGRYSTLWGVENAFPDQFDLEHSRDIEPTKGGYGDNYYYQMVANIRRFKGMEAPEPVSGPATITVDGDFSDWSAVTPGFVASKGNVQIRNGQGYLDPATGLPIQYVNNTARNDIVGAKVARDAANLFFLVETADPLSPRTDPNWMQLLIDLDRDKNTGWEGYEFMVDRHAANGKATLSSSAGAWSWTDVGEVDYQLAGNRIEIAIPRTLLGLQPTDAVDLEFKWLDSPASTGDIMDVYVNGEAAPSGRFNFLYTEGDLTPPMVVTLDPADGATGAVVDRGLTMTFNEAVQLGAGNIVVRRVSDGAMIESIDVSSGSVTVDGTAVTIDLGARLDAFTGYHVEVDPGVIRDLSGNSFGGITGGSAWAFATGGFVINNFADGSDAATGISSATTYTHLVDINKDADTADINGVIFDNTLATYTLTGPNNNLAGNGNNGADPGSGMEDMLDNFRFGGSSHTLTVSGLTPGTTYKLRLYVSHWNGANVSFSFDDTTPATMVTGVNRGAGQTIPSSFDYTYTLDAGDTDLKVTLTADDGSNNMHWYGFSNEVVGGGGDTFAGWISNPTFGLDPAEHGFALDPDGDRIPNGLEAWFGTHPGQFSPGLADLATDGTTSTVTHPQNENPPSDLTGFYEWSPNLSDWYGNGGGPGGGPTVSFVPNTVGTTTTVTATSSEPLDRLFLRAGVTQD